MNNLSEGWICHNHVSGTIKLKKEDAETIDSLLKTEQDSIFVMERVTKSI